MYSLALIMESKGVSIFLKDIILKVNIIVCLEFELTSDNVTFQLVNSYDTDIHP